jgi:hypothetical protein
MIRNQSTASGLWLIRGIAAFLSQTCAKKATLLRRLPTTMQNATSNLAIPCKWRIRSAVTLKKLRSN